eukprot:m.299199 g.299199  ORF g.299199 m.299199 type:complete len:761 (+) comp15867_c1_seq9:55-2337(+)
MSSRSGNVPSTAATLGIGVLLSRHTRLCGSVFKKRPDDFWVTEIDTSGVSVSLSSEYNIPTTAMVKQNESKPISSHPDAAKAANCAKRAKATSGSLVKSFFGYVQDKLHAATVGSLQKVKALPASAPAQEHSAKVEHLATSTLPESKSTGRSITATSTKAECLAFIQAVLPANVLAELDAIDTHSTIVVPFDDGTWSKDKRRALYTALSVAYPMLTPSTHTNRTGRAGTLVYNKAFQELCTYFNQDDAGAILWESSFGKGNEIFVGHDISPVHLREAQRVVFQFKQLDCKVVGVTRTSIGEGPSQPCLRVRRRPKRNAKRSSSSESMIGASTKGSGEVADNDYLWAVLQKRNVESFDCQSLLAEHLKVSAHDISFAGVKDKVGVTTQLVGIRGCSLDALERTKSALNHKGIFIANASEAVRPLSTGELLGNRFGLCLRNVTQSPKVVAEAVTSVSRHGFINYFGQQRFGSLTSQHAMHHIGRELVRKNFLLAARYLLGPDESETHPDAIEARGFLQSFPECGDEAVKAALRRMPSRKRKEVAVLRGIKRFGLTNAGCARAFGTIPHSTRLLFVHSYTSYIWNCCATERCKKYGHQVVCGDFVLSDSEEVEDERGEHIVGYYQGKTVVCVTQQDVDQHRYQVEQVVLPILGEKTKFPPVLQSFLDKVLVDDGIQLGDFNMKALRAKCTGSFRRVFVKPQNLTWQHHERSQTLNMQFGLPTGSYATELLRELCDPDTPVLAPVALQQKQMPPIPAQTQCCVQ